MDRVDLAPASRRRPGYGTAEMASGSMFTITAQGPLPHHCSELSHRYSGGEKGLGRGGVAKTGLCSVTRQTPNLMYAVFLLLSLSLFSYKQREKVVPTSGDELIVKIKYDTTHKACKALKWEAML